jgi:hypothetical protein
MKGNTCKSCGVIQVITAEGKLLCGNKLDAEIVGEIENCWLCELIGGPNSEEAISNLTLTVKGVKV